MANGGDGVDNSRCRIETWADADGVPRTEQGGSALSCGKLAVDLRQSRLNGLPHPPLPRRRRVRIRPQPCVLGPGLHVDVAVVTWSILRRSGAVKAASVRPLVEVDVSGVPAVR
jgi:hypothetical protein